jgi:hypothetical protein
MSVQFPKETLKGRAVVQVFTWMDLVTQVDAGFVETIENRPPTPRQLGETVFD